MKTLSAAEEARAAKLHAESIVVDTLGPFGPSSYTPEMLKRLDEILEQKMPVWSVADELSRMSHSALLRNELPGFWEGWDQAGVDVVSLTRGTIGAKPFTFENAVRDIAQTIRAIEVLGDRLVKVTRTADAERAKTEGKRGVILNFQNSDHLDGDLANLELFYNLGIRILMLTYNSRNLAGDGCTERVQSGLSHFGVQLVREMNDMGILVDLAHCGEATTLDAIAASDKPVAITHSCAKAIASHDRAKSDDVIRALGEAGGYFGVCVVPFFISESSEPSLDDWLRHFEHVVELAGIENVGIGSDWGAELPKSFENVLNEEMKRFGFREEHRVDWAATVEGYRSWREWPNLTRALVAHGYRDEEVRGFLGGNFLRVFSEALDG